MNHVEQIKQNDQETSDKTHCLYVMTQYELQVLVMQISKNILGCHSSILQDLIHG